MLSDEIRKPYFLKLKTFLWDQGVKGPSDSAKGLKVYPERKIAVFRNASSALTYRANSEEHLCLVQPDAAGAG